LSLELRLDGLCLRPVLVVFDGEMPPGEIPEQLPPALLQVRNILVCKGVGSKITIFNSAVWAVVVGFIRRRMSLAASTKGSGRETFPTWNLPGFFLALNSSDP
jgi:hypothetical protein